MSRDLSPGLLVTWLCCAIAAAEDEAPTVVLHNGTRATPGANLAYLNDRLEWHPYALLGAGWDNNPDQAPVADDSDGFADWAVGAVADVRASVSSHLALCAALFQRRYRRTDGRDLSGGSFDARFTDEGPQVTLKSRVLIDRSDDPLVETGRSVERDRMAGNLLLIHPGASNRLEGEVRVAHVDYREDGITFDEDERDRLQGEGRLGLAHLLSATSEVGGRVTALAVRYYSGDTLYQDSVGARAELTTRLRPLPHVTLSANGGYQFERYDGPFRDDPDYDDEQVAGPVAGLTLRWDASDGCWLGLSGASRWIESSTSNAARLSGIEGSWEQRLGQRATLFSFAGISRREDVSGGDEAAEHAEEYSLGTGVTARLVPGLTAEMRLRWREYLPSDAPGYDQFIASLLVAYVL